MQHWVCKDVTQKQGYQAKREKTADNAGRAQSKSSPASAEGIQVVEDLVSSGT